MKKIKMKNYNFGFMIKPLLILSILSIPIYVMKLFEIKNADILYSAAVFIIIVLSLMLNIKNTKTLKLFIVMIFFLIIAYICFYDKTVLLFINFCKNSAVKFGMMNTIFNTFGLYDFQNFADYSSYGGSFYMNQEIVNGSVNAFKMNPLSSVVSQFLTSRYLLLFSLSGIALAEHHKNLNCWLIVMISLLTGSPTALLLLLLFIHPVNYLLSLIAAFVCCFVSSAVGIKFGFLYAPSVFELLLQNENKIYSMVVCMLFFCISYYSARLVNEKLK